MTLRNNLTAQPIHPASLAKRMLIGAGFGLAFILFFLNGASTPNPEWGKLWMVRPLIIVPLAGAAGGAVFYFLSSRNYNSGWKKALALVLSVLISLFILWIGVILGLDGTYWD